MKIKLTYEFDSLADFQDYMDGVGTERAAVVSGERQADATIPVTAELLTTTAVVADVTNPTVDVRTDAPAEPEITATHDSDGLPYDPEIHATPKSFTVEGQWRSKRGKSKEALEARAAFKASGGNVQPPAAAMPAAMPTAAAMPGLPPLAPPPVTYDALVSKTVGMMERGVINADTVIALYAKVGVTDPAVLETNESMRAALFNALTEIEA